MHYQDGTEAKVGDIVTGTGANLPYQITGPVIAVEARDKCNIAVETVIVIAKFIPYYSDGDGGTDVPAHFEFSRFTERGDSKRFKLVTRQGWKQVQSKELVWTPENK